ncbi:serine/threonine protein kinase [Micromonospora chalcea]|uniref:serine/threonine-protein kinase n=1 Tax=Micromonospora chalcea TaxID=1874 RepID=UPI00165730F4|nr:serine/threonine-protein kinase [Micromonospora chalcea]MBC8989276.1 serine/threonine protein kinase [Micromonospora chalcea]
MRIFEAADVAAAFGVDASYLGTGGFGETWRIGTEAVKIIHRESAERVEREIESLGRVDHPNVVRLVKVDRAVIKSARYSVIVFEFVDGGDVNQVIAQGSYLPVQLLQPFLSGLLSGVHALHGAGVLHRDIKPANVVLRRGSWSEPVILDLGLARLSDLTSITAYPAMVGTLPFMPPEQILGRRARKAADIFAVGVLTRMAITGEHPFIPMTSATHVDAEQLLRAIEAGPRPLPASISPEVRELLDRMVSYHEHRRGSAAACLRYLESM